MSDLTLADLRVVGEILSADGADISGLIGAPATLVDLVAVVVAEGGEEVATDGYGVFARHFDPGRYLVFRIPEDTPSDPQ